MRRSALLTALVGLVSLVLLASPTQAAQPTVLEHFSNDDTVTVSDFCGFEEVQLHIVERGLFTEQFRGDSAYPHFAQRGSETFTWTNPETGKTFTVVNRYSDKDLHVVDNGDGTLTITVNTTINRRVYGPDGEFLFADRGHVRAQFLVATNGTIDPEDDEFLGDIGEPRISGNFATIDRDFCEDFIQYTS